MSAPFPAWANNVLAAGSASLPRGHPFAVAALVSWIAFVMTGDVLLAWLLEDDTLTTRLVDELVASVLDRPEPAPRRPKWQLSPLVPAAHGVLALGTVLLAVLAAVSTRR